MKNKYLIPSIVLAAVLLLSLALVAKTGPKTLRMSQDEMMDRIKGGWAGQTIGCTFGGPTEFCWRGEMIPDSVAIEWDDTSVVHYFDRSPGLYDDVYMDLTFLAVMDRLGVQAPVDSIAMAYAKAPYPLWHANQAARYNVQRGVMPPLSGDWKNNPHADDIDYQIEADYAGLISPGMPEAANRLSDRVGHIMCYGNGWYGGVLVGTMYSLAFTYPLPSDGRVAAADIEDLISRSLRAIPQKSSFRQCMDEVVRLHAQYPDDWKKSWQELEARWSDEKGCSEGVKNPLNIDAMMNCAYVLIGLLYGEGDFARTMDISCRCGQDSDCNPATAAGILGTMMGYDAIDQTWTSALLPVENRPFAYTDISLNDACELSMRLAADQILENGGKIEGDMVSIRTQKVRPVRFEESFPGLVPDTICEHPALEQLSDFHFTGSAIVVAGYLDLREAGETARIAVYVDGELKQELDLPANFHDRAIDLCWVYGLEQGPHVLSIRPLDPRHAQFIIPQRAIIYRNN